MNRKELKEYILNTFGVTPDTPFESSPTHEVFRHSANKKWFGLILDVKREKLGLCGEGFIDVVNLKCDKLMIGSVKMNKGVFSGYHMNKSSWISVALDGTADNELIKTLVGMSYELTMPKIKKRKASNDLEVAILRVREMEKHFDDLKKAVETGDKTLEERLKKILTDYYENGLWLSDYDRDEKGEFPQNLKRGVLSQDGLYNQLQT